MKTKQTQEPVGWMESPHGAIRANLEYRFIPGPKTLSWSLPLYLHPAKTTDNQNDALCRLRKELAKERLKAERLQEVLDCRPALNAGLYEDYVRWSEKVGAMEFLRALCEEN
jgi:hypothetical protein